MSVQLVALAAVVAVVIAAAIAGRIRAWRARRSLAGKPPPAQELGSAGDPYILYFTGRGCTVCRTHQEPALSTLSGVRVERVDAIEGQELARRYRVYTLPTTIVMSGGGAPLDVNYGYAPASKLRSQLARAKSGPVPAAAEQAG